jgi:hypothetical protein
LLKTTTPISRNGFSSKKKNENENEESSKSDHDNDLHSGNQEVIEGHLHDESISITASNKAPLLSMCERIATVFETRLESISDMKSQSRELRRQRISIYYRFKRWENGNR